MLIIKGMNREKLLEIAKPILFSTEMVRANLDGIKTRTRRVVQPQPDEDHKFFLGVVTCSTDGKNIGSCGWGTNENGGSIQYAKPRYRVGDILWVRETWCELPKHKYHYRADAGRGTDKEFFEAVTDIKWRPSRYMPKAAARIFLEVTSVRGERVQDITPDEARAEGHPGRPFSTRLPIDPRVHDDAAMDWYMDLWDHLNAKRGYPYASNPWVWVYGLKAAK